MFHHDFCCSVRHLFVGGVEEVTGPSSVLAQEHADYSMSALIFVHPNCFFFKEVEH